MNIQSLSFSLLKIISVYIFTLFFLPTLFSLITLLNPETYKDQTIVVTMYWATYSLALLIICLILWFKANQISERISASFLKEDLPLETVGLNSSQIIDIGFILLGIYLIVDRLPTFISETYLMLDLSSLGSEFQKSNVSTSFIQSCITLFLGLVLIIGRHTLLNWILKLRTAGLKR